MTGRRRHLVLLVAVAVATLMAGVGGLYAAFAATRETNQAQQGVSLGSVDVSGFGANRLNGLVTSLAQEARLSITYDDTTVSGGLAELGVTVDQAATVEAVLRADPGASVMSDQKKWATQTVPLTHSLNETVLNTWLTSHFAIDQASPADATATFDATAGQFVVTPSHSGWVFDLAPLKQALTELATQPETPVAVTVNLIQQAPHILDDAAQAAAQTANARLGLSFSFAIDGGAAYTATPADIASWIQLTPNLAAGRLTVSYPAIVINSQLSPVLSQALGQPGEPRRVVVSHDGTFLTELSPGQSGVAVEDLTETARTVADLLGAGRGSDLLVSATPVSPATVTTTLAQGPTSGQWIDVDLSTQVATLMNGSHLDQSYVISSGKAETPTPTGTFTVYAKVALQDMNGYNADGSTHSIPNVPWATWFWGDYGFHAAYWLDESQIGTPQSHGCINMRVADAKYLYDWATTKTSVVIHGQTPPDAAPDSGAYAAKG